MSELPLPRGADSLGTITNWGEGRGKWDKVSLIFHHCWTRTSPLVEGFIFPIMIKFTWSWVKVVGGCFWDGFGWVALSIAPLKRFHIQGCLVHICIFLFLENLRKGVDFSLVFF